MDRLDYSLTYPPGRDRSRPDGVLVEEFALRDDFTAAGLDSAVWTVDEREWLPGGWLSRALRSDPAVRTLVVPVRRDAADDAFQQLTGSPLPDEAALRGHFGEREPLPGGEPLRWGPESDERVYRILFANHLGQSNLAALQAEWGLEPVEDPRLAGRARVTVADHAVEWALRSIGPGIAWCIDATVRLGHAPSGAIGDLLHDLRQGVRRHGLIPVTIERFT
ncbi:hypothetical protein F4553_007341 [Allocatelliglobosispora scoriae]|uniref:Uncharacterized protein n=1 Tax=Allocatelliglobosispora scoriae TaxID=643052 RepID=A0A841BXN0_9ACTN|nr:hypothetical protein [Allocatelliglobosispora scoriae]MBB5873907.1 hypothetical protein [Allocatelliglobosispora scoriae]